MNQTHQSDGRTKLKYPLPRAKPVVEMEDCAECNNKGNEVKKKRLKLSPELVDGEHEIPVTTKEQLLEAIGVWYDNTFQDTSVGESFTVEVIEMSDKEISELPTI